MGKGKYLFYSFTFLFIIGTKYGFSNAVAAKQNSIAEEFVTYQSERIQMVETQIRERGVTSPPVLKAMEKVPRHVFVPEFSRTYSYVDSPIPIGYGQTISQPYIVAYMSEALDIKPTDRILEIGTGSGYQAAVLAELAAEVYTIEIIPELARSASQKLRDWAPKNIQIKQADGYFGWMDQAPFDKIMVTAASEFIPPPLIQQLKDGGKMIIPIGTPYITQTLMLVEKNNKEISTKSLIPVRFVPLQRN